MYWFVQTVHVNNKLYVFSTTAAFCKINNFLFISLLQNSPLVHLALVQHDDLCFRTLEMFMCSLPALRC